MLLAREEKGFNRVLKVYLWNWAFTLNVLGAPVGSARSEWESWVWRLGRSWQDMLSSLDKQVHQISREEWKRPTEGQKTHGAGNFISGQCRSRDFPDRTPVAEWHCTKDKTSSVRVRVCLEPVWRNTLGSPWHWPSLWGRSHLLCRKRQI